MNRREGKFRTHRLHAAHFAGFFAVLLQKTIDAIGCKDSGLSPQISAICKICIGHRREGLFALLSACEH
jgi:hypothetical protein